MISYAQNYEDVMLARAFADQSLGFYIDIGAMDPTDGSVTRHSTTPGGAASTSSRTRDSIGSCRKRESEILIWPSR
jgi:hypothetical protein